ncbi:MAG: hypothetical protein ACRDHY_15595 [Anaerolineales bacterium]
MDGLHRSVRALESALAEPDDGRMCLVLAKLALDSILEALPPVPEGDEEGFD